MRLTDEQLRAIERRDGPLLVRAGAGTGKTSVLVERFVRAVTDDGVEVPQILAITFTDKAAAQLKARIRQRFIELGHREHARATEGAWISTIHGFCSRLLRAHALSAGIDPEYRVLDALESERLGLDAFDRALEAFLGAPGDPGRLELVAAYTPDKLRAMVRTAYSRLRSRGERRPSLPEVDAPEASAGAAARAELVRAVSEALAELGAAGGHGKQVEDGIALLERCAESLGRGDSHDPHEVESLRLKGSAKALKGSACEAYEQARLAYEDWCSRSRAAADHSLLRELLALYGERYDELKRLRSGLDFEDLELLARDLLRQHPGIREQYAGRFVHVLVDEFQDTNRLQNSLLELISRDNLFRVGDEHQSIYGFRNADVSVFREHHSRAALEDRVESLTTNFRSRPQLLDAIDMAFERVWEEGFEPLRPPPGADEEPSEPSLELLVVDRGRGRLEPCFGDDLEPFGQSMRSVAPWRACEARLLAKRVHELTADGDRPYRDVVLLFRATTHMSVYERALEERGIPTHVVGGRGYWSQQQVGDLRHWLAALANPRDELAIFSVLASPLVGASLDAMAIVGLGRRRLGRDAWWALSDAFLDSGDGSGGLAGRLPEADRELIAHFVRLFDAERRAAPRISLERLIDRAVARTGYDRRILALPAGDRRLANVRKLMRMAREYEADEGRDLRGFIDFVSERDLIQEREGEAPLEAEELDAVRLMTVHRAKGLEFPVVCLADLGKSGREDYGALRISEDGQLGLRLASLGGGSVDSTEMREIREQQRLNDEEEERRIFYVAMTRAQEHLVLSGATDLRSRPEPAPLEEPMRWVWRSFCPGLPNEEAAGELSEEWEGREVRVRWTRCAADTLGELLSPTDCRPLLHEPSRAGLEATPSLELGEVPAPRALPVSRLSYSGLEAYKRCAYRFYLERALRLPGRDSLELDGDRSAGLRSALDLGAGPELAETDAPEPRAADELPALLLGTIVHELLERLDFRRPLVPSAEQVASVIERHGLSARAGDVDAVRGLIQGFCDSELRERIAHARRVRTEQSFAFALELPEAAGRSLLVNGFLDVHAVEDERTLVVDYKTDPLDGRTPADLCEEKYATQRLVYALAALRAGAEQVDVAHLFLEQPDTPVLAGYEAGDVERLERELLELARGILELRFDPTDRPHRELCADCPGQPALCSWGPERTLAAG